MRLFLVLLQNRVKAYCVILFVGWYKKRRAVDKH